MQSYFIMYTVCVSWVDLHQNKTILNVHEPVGSVALSLTQDKRNSTIVVHVFLIGR